MKFSASVDQARALLQRTGKLTYRVLKREFVLDDEALEDLKEQFVNAEEVALDKDDKMLVWKGAGDTPSVLSSPAAHSQPPVSYTPPHLAERIRAEQGALEARGNANGEHKSITALFADIQDSTALIEDLDPEAARRLIDPALQLMKAPRRSGRRFLLPLASLFLVGLLAQCTPRPPAQPAQVQERTPPQVLSPEEQLELFNTYLDRG
jgi:hypothetical protein